MVEDQMSIVRKISAKGSIVIPAEYRKRYGLNPGARIRIVDYGGSLALVPVLDDPIRALAGKFKGARLTQSLLKERAKDKQREN
jgi:AbrB family looped-hinge helix DNA binding protein